MKPEQESQLILDRLTGMGVNARLMQGGRCVLASVRLQATLFDGLDEPLRVEQIVFATVGRDRIKCLRPRALFQLPLIRIADCRDIIAIEARIRLAWKKHVGELTDTRHWLMRIGADVRVGEQGSVLSFPMDTDEGRGQMIDPRRVILPSRSPIAGIALARLEDRAPYLDRNVSSIVDLQMALTTRMEELARIHIRLDEERRRNVLSDAEVERVVRDRSPRRTPILIVGPNLTQQRSCIESLQLRGYEVHTAHNERGGLQLYDKVSPEFVLCDIQLGRSEGTDFILSLRRVYGIEEIPVVLVDTARHTARRDAARRVGAAGYLVQPVDVRSIAKRIDKMIVEPKRRRFTRYPSRLPIQIEGVESRCIASALGRGGMFLNTADGLDLDGVYGCQMTLPEVGKSVAFEAEVLYHRPSAGKTLAGVGLRFNDFESNQEPVLLDYLRTVGASASA